MKIVLIGLAIAVLIVAVIVFYFLSQMKNGYKVEQGQVLFYQWSGADGQTVQTLDADAKTFKSLDDRYALDHQKVFFLVRIIEGADPKTFQKIKVNKRYAEDIYSRDLGAIYIRDKKFTEADLATFQVVGYGYTKDKNSVYYERKKVEGADPASFQMILNDKDEYNIRFKDIKNEYDRSGKIYNP